MFVLPKGLNIPPDTIVMHMCNSRPLQLVTAYKFLGVFLDNRLSWEAQILHITRKASQKIGALFRTGRQLTLPAKRLFYMAIIAADIEYGSNAFYSSLSTAYRRKSLFASPSVVSEQFSELHRGRHLFHSTSNFKFAAFLNEWTINCLFSLTDFTYRCTHSLTSTLLTNEFSVLGQSNAHTHTQSITRDQSFISLSLPNVCHRSGTISPLFTCSIPINQRMLPWLLWPTV